MASFIADNTFRHEQVSFDPAKDAVADGNKVIEALLSSVPDLKLYTRSSPSFESLRAVYNTLITAQPLVICRPQTVAQVQSIVKAVKGLGVPLAVRCGGHDVWGRGCIADSVTIDMRELDAQVLADDKQTVTIGGGITSGNFVGFLGTHGLGTAQGTVNTVGWVGWVLWGGYGPLNDIFGMGVDNVLGAKVITADGELVDADEELLWGIRGAGGNLGVVVELKVKVHRLDRILGGYIGYDWQEAEKVLLGLQDLIEKGVPDAFCVQFGFMKNEWGTCATLVFIWADSANLEEGKKWHNIVKGLGTVVIDTTSETTYKEFQAVISEPLIEPDRVYTRSTSIPRFTSATISQLLKRVEAIPGERSYTLIAHLAHGKGTKPNPAACFGTRKPHILFHINACDEEERMPEGKAWVDGVVSALESTGESTKSTYASFMGEDEDTSHLYADGWDRLKALKKRVDGQNVFKYSQPKL
ncbi:FAD-linked oxidoreductase aurO [Cladobotryum mycophilum]|uniref:FAD-linked oxidoreductase aurO n=1 Tax=Cladobotryum mycophilum TaxID=491253 RepID=A0ABR0S858_9HYPO